MQGKNGINQQSQRENNLSLVIRAIHGDDQCSRVKLTETTGLKQATITKIVNQLIEWGLVSETESLGSIVGRRPIRLVLNGEQYMILSVRINRNYLRVAVYDILGQRKAHTEVPIDPLFGARVSMDQLKELIRRMMRQTGVPFLAIGIALPGPFDAQRQQITLMSGFPGWEKIHIREELEQAFRLPVFLDHDANCGALAELWYGKHKNVQHMVYVAGDRGVGAGLILGGSIYRGRMGFAGEIGHSSINVYGPICECGNHGCLELYCSTKAIEREYQRESFDIRTGGTPPESSFSDICRLVRAGDPVACRVYSQAISFLAFGLVSVVNTINPDVVIFTDRIVEGGPLFLTTVQEVFKEYLMPVVHGALQVDVSELENDPMLLGASVLAFEQMLLNPSETFGQHKPEHAKL